MPKMKTNSSAKKRFVLTGTGAIKRKHAFKSHILTKKSKKRNLTWFSVAVSVALLVSLFFGKQQYNKNKQRKEAQRIYAQVSKGLGLLSKNLKKGEQALAVLYTYENTINKILK